MASYLLPGIQKRLLRYALSRLEVLDTEALDLEHLDITWGTKSILEFRNIGLRLEKLEGLLQLPPTFCLAKAIVPFLRITIPVDIYRSSIVVNIDGVVGQLRISSSPDEKSKSQSQATNHDRNKSSSIPTNTSQGDEVEQVIPNPADLAASFLATEPLEERVQLEKELQSEDLYASIAHSDDGEEDSGVGTGAGLSLPMFMTNFLQGIVDRLEVSIRDICVDVDVAILQDTTAQTEMSGLSDTVTFRLQIDGVEVEGLTGALSEDPTGAGQHNASLLKEGKRLVSLSGIRGLLISEANLFTGLARSSGLSSPTTTHSELSEAKLAGSPQFSRKSSIAETMTKSTISEQVQSRSTSPESRHSSPVSQKTTSLSTSVIESDNGRFDDASEAGDFNRSGDIDQISNFGNSVFENSALMEQLTDSQLIGDDDDVRESPPLAFARDSSPMFASPSSTPRASMYIGSSPSASLTARQRGERSQGLLHSAALPIHQRRISVDRISKSQPLNQVSEFSSPLRSSIPDQGFAEQFTGELTPENGGYSGDEDLAQSKIFSHEDAESMYLSAMSFASARQSQHSGSSDSLSAPRNQDISPIESDEQLEAMSQSIYQLPDDDDDASGSRTPVRPKTPPMSTGQPESILTSPKDPAQESPATPPPKDGSPVLSPTASSKPGPVLKVPSTPKIQHATTNLSDKSGKSAQEYGRLAKQILEIDQVCIYLPGTPSETIVPAHDPAESIVADSNLAAASVYPDVPGAFSVHTHKASTASSPPGRSTISSSHTATPKSTPDELDESIGVTLGRVYTRFDFSVGRIVASLVFKVLEAVKGAKPTTPVAREDEVQPGQQEDQSFKLRVGHISLKFLEHLSGQFLTNGTSPTFDNWTKPIDSNVLLRTTLKGLAINHDISKGVNKTLITLQKFIVGYAGESIVSFDADLRMRSSVRDLSTAAGVDLSILVLQSAIATRVKIDTLPLHVSIDLQRLDETFSWFGGLSSVLNMGSSMASNATMTTSPSKPVSKPRSVRFETPIKPEDTSVASQNKVDARIGGFVLDLVGKECSIGLETTAVKAVSRDEGIGVAIDKIKLSGPHLRDSLRSPAIIAELDGTRVEYLMTPKDIDLDRLLSLITPSKAKYDQDDDILLDTLLRQRRQGSVLRVTIEASKTRVSELADLKYLPQIGEEVSRLGTVAKYLPEDDRPGLLVLMLVRKLEVQADIDNAIGSLHLVAKEFEVAEITMPSLTAISLGSLELSRNGTEELIGAATDVELRDPGSRLPALMARMIGDEMEPIVKVRCWNVKAEYRVTTLMSILDLSEENDADDMAASMVASVATLTGRARKAMSNPPPSTAKAKSSKATKPLTVDVTLQDCILGLNPLGLPSKVLVTFTDAHLSIVLPHDNHTSATGELQKASLLVIDDVSNIRKSVISRPRGESFDHGSSQVADLCGMGFVTVSYISSAKAIIHIMDSGAPDDRSIDIELRDDLLVLESCADSTQTLIAALNGLTPPSRPSKDTKYRTEVIPVEDLLASLSGEAFGTAEGDYDFDADFGADIRSETESLLAEEPHDLSIDSQYYQGGGSDLYNADDFMDEDGERKSVLSDGLSTRDTNDGVLLESFADNGPVGLIEELDFQEDHFGSGSILEGTAHRWNSAKNTYDRSNEVKVKKSPLKVCIRDVHIIWNLFDGYDWQHTRDVISKAVQDVESRALEKRSRHDTRSTFEQDIDDEETVIGDFLFNSIYIGIPANRDPRELALAINQELNDNATETESVATTSYTTPSRVGSTPRLKGKRLRLNRSKHHKITFELRGINVDVVSFPPGSGETQSSIDVRVRDFEIFDHVPTSTWKKFATYMHDAGERESGASQVHIELLNVKPVPELAAAEIVLKVTILPLRLHVDQDALDFITRFFEFKDTSAPAQSSSSDEPFLQRVEVNSIPVKLDFKPKRVDYAGLRSGHTTEFMNFLVLDEADMVLRHTIIYGIRGFERMGKMLNDIWMPDVKRNQLPGILAGLAPVRSLVNVGGGVRDLVVVPMREYKKDGRIVRSIAKGAAAFANTTGTELVKLGAKIAVGTQAAARNAEEMLTQTGSHAGVEDETSEDEEPKQISLYSNQPIGFAHGLKSAYAGLERDLATVKNAIIAISGEVMESGSAAGAAKAVAKGAPTVVLTPVRAIAGGAGQVLMGAANTLDPKNRKRIDDKYKRH